MISLRCSWLPAALRIVGSCLNAAAARGTLLHRLRIIVPSLQQLHSVATTSASVRLLCSKRRVTFACDFVKLATHQYLEYGTMRSRTGDTGARIFCARYMGIFDVSALFTECGSLIFAAGELRLKSSASSKVSEGRDCALLKTEHCVARYFVCAYVGKH